MPNRDKYITLHIDDQPFDLPTEGQIPLIDYALEDEQDFEQKKSAEAFNIELPATANNQQGFNTGQNPSVLDNTLDSSFDRPRPARYVANGNELLVGKFFFGSAKEKDGRVSAFTGKLYGLNGDWVIDLKEKTLYDFLNMQPHTFDLATIVNSWNFDGKNEKQDYVYAPIRYRKAFGDYPAADPNNPDQNLHPDDSNVLINDLRPSLSVYWFLYRGFKSVGYRIVSKFFDTDYYRRGVLPWTWGGFDYLDDTRWEPLKFLAKGPEVRHEAPFDGISDVGATIDANTQPGAYENTPGTFAYTSGSSSIPFMMKWQYPDQSSSLQVGKVNARLSVQLNYSYKIQNGGAVKLFPRWYKNGTMVREDQILDETITFDTRENSVFQELFFDVDIEPGDYIGLQLYEKVAEAAIIGFARLTVRVEQFQLDYIKLTENSTINFNNYPKFKNYKWLDLLRGEVDLFDLSIQTDPIKKEVYIEPTHAYDMYENGVAVPKEGYYNRKQLEWTQKQDLSQESTLEVFSDYEREFIFKFKDDQQDGGLKKVQDRNQVIIGQCKYLLPERYKTGKKERENRFYAPVMHYEHDSFRYITGISPQLIAIIPENVANTSNEASENTYEPKRAYYKGNIEGVGGWKFEGTTYSTLPFVFAVNYKAGGELDPVLSYSDQAIAGKIGKGLTKKFFLQRLAILRHGRRYNPVHIRLNNHDIMNFLHRESVILRDMEYIITSISSYNPVTQESTAVAMWLFVPVNDKDKNAIYPSLSSLQNTGSSDSFDVKYWHHKLLNSDLTK